MSKEYKLRLNYVDYLKCFAIYLVVLGHCTIDSKLMHIIYSFHLPLFFFLSGYVFNVKKYLEKTDEFFISRLKNLLLPYIKYCTYIVVFLFILTRVKGEKIAYTLFDIINALFLGLRFGSCGISLWFIISLFTIQLFILNFYRIFKHDRMVLLISLLLSFATISITSGTNYRLPFYLDLSLVFLLIFELGFLSRKFNILNLLINKLYIYI